VSLPEVSINGSGTKSPSGCKSQSIVTIEPGACLAPRRIWDDFARAILTAPGGKVKAVASRKILKIANKKGSDDDIMMTNKSRN
jgi:hypothetical protein